MKLEDYTDAGLVKAGHIEVFAARFGDKEFIVRKRLAGRACQFVAGVDTTDGDTEWTTDPKLARIFSGSEWATIWAKPELDLITPDAY